MKRQRVKRRLDYVAPALFAATLSTEKGVKLPNPSDRSSPLHQGGAMMATVNYAVDITKIGL